MTKISYQWDRNKFHIKAVDHCKNTEFCNGLSAILGGMAQEILRDSEKGALEIGLLVFESGFVEFAGKVTPEFESALKRKFGLIFRLIHTLSNQGEGQIDMGGVCWELENIE